MKMFLKLSFVKNSCTALEEGQDENYALSCSSSTLQSRELEFCRSKLKESWRNSCRMNVDIPVMELQGGNILPWKQIFE